MRDELTSGRYKDVFWVQCYHKCGQGWCLDGFLLGTFIGTFIDLGAHESISLRPLYIGIQVDFFISHRENYILIKYLPANQKTIIRHGVQKEFDGKDGLFGRMHSQRSPLWNMRSFCEQNVDHQLFAAEHRRDLPDFQNGMMIWNDHNPNFE